MKNDRININKKLLPYRFNIRLGDNEYRFEVRYNKTADLFTISLHNNGRVITTEPVIYGTPMFINGYIPYIYPPLKIVPLDESGEEKTVTFDNFCNTVFLTIDNGGGLDE